jgi:hypothetical protein
MRAHNKKRDRRRRDLEINLFSADPPELSKQWFFFIARALDRPIDLFYSRTSARSADRRPGSVAVARDTIERSDFGFLEFFPSIASALALVVSAKDTA